MRQLSDNEDHVESSLPPRLTGRTQASTIVKALVAITTMYTLSIALMIASTTKERLDSERATKAALLAPAMVSRTSDEDLSGNIGRRYATALVW